MDHGVLLVQRRDTDDLVDVARTVEANGFDLLGLNDSQAIFRELYATLAVVADRTDDIPLGPTVTNPVTRHPTVTANGVCTVDELSGGRAFLGLGSGESSVKTIGKPPARLGELRRYGEAVRALTRGEVAEWEGEPMTVRWIEDHEDGFDVPLYVSAAGPKTLEMAGAVADGVFIANGVGPDVVEDSVARVAAGAERAGRDPGAVDTWVFAKINLGASKRAAIDEIRHALAASANFVFRSVNEDTVPDALVPRIREFRERYDPGGHEQPGHTHNVDLMEELELTEFLAERFAITGTPDDCVEHVEALEAVDGVDGLLYAALTEDDRALVEGIAEGILPQVT